MKIRYKIFSVILTGIVITSCTQSKTDKTSEDNNKLIAEKIDSPSKAVFEEEKTEEKVLNIAEFTAIDKGFSTLTSIIKATGASETLSSEGPYTILAPANLAFDKLPEGTLDHLLKPDNKEQLKTILDCHIIKGIQKKDDLVDAIKKGNGSIKLKTINGTVLTATRKSGDIFLIDQMGNGGVLVTTDVKASNGLIHTIDAVMMPKK